MSDQWYVEVDVETDSDAIAQQAEDALVAKWPEWVSTDSDLTTVLIQALAPLAQNANEAASRLLAAAFRKFGTDLVGVPYSNGSYATGLLDITLTDNLGHTIPADFEFDIDGFAFAVDSDTTVLAGATVANNVPVTATLIGEAANGLAGTTVVPISSLSFIQSATLDAVTANGTEPQDDAAYQSDLSLRLQLQADTLVTERDFEIFAILWPGIGRAIFQNNGARTVTGAVTDDAGEVVGSSIKTDLIAAMQVLEQVNTVISVGDATYTTVNVSYAVAAYPYPNYDLVDLITRINSAISGYLNPASWGTDRGVEATPNKWFNDPVVRINKLIDLIASVDGVNYVGWVTLTGSAGTVDGTNQKDTIDFTGTVTGGNYDVTIDGQTALAIPYNATAATVQSTLEGLSNVAPGDIVVTGGPGPTDIVIEHTGQYAHRARTVAVVNHVTGGGSVARTVTQAEVDGTGDLTMPGTFSLPRTGTLTGRTL